MPAAPILVVLLAYGLMLVGIALWSRRTSRTVAGYYLADKQLPSWVIAFSTNATGESAWLLLGLTGMGYAVGFHALLAGFLAAILWVVLFKAAALELYEMIPGFAAGFLVTIGVSLFTAPPSGAAAEFDEVHWRVRTPRLRQRPGRRPSRDTARAHDIQC
jgi:Na+/proline symporter